MSTEIYYFSGTGNSLHVAKELQQRIPESKLLPIVSFKNMNAVQAQAKKVGFIFPIHLMTMPDVVHDFIKQIDLQSAQYIFAIATRGGTPCNDMFAKIEKILRKKGKTLDAFLICNMASNSPKFKDWRPPTIGEMEKFEADIQERLTSFAEIIKSEGSWKEEDRHFTIPISPAMEHVSYLLAEMWGDGHENFFADSNCSGCGICEVVCLSDKIQLTNDRPVWLETEPCYSCYACLNYCPNHAVQIKSTPFVKYYTDENGRYYHPSITVDEIEEQKKHFESVKN